MRRHRNAKIVATLGPARSSPEIVRSLFDAGADVFRLNFSHGAHEDHKKRYPSKHRQEMDSLHGSFIWRKDVMAIVRLLQSASLAIVLSSAGHA